jgi:hypothetical protein
MGREDRFVEPDRTSEKIKRKVRQRLSSETKVQTRILPFRIGQDLRVLSAQLMLGAFLMRLLTSILP